MDFTHMYNYFQYLGPNKTRHIQIVNVDPKIALLPTSLLESLMKKGNIENMKNTIKIAE